MKYFSQTPEPEALSFIVRQHNNKRNFQVIVKNGNERRIRNSASYFKSVKIIQLNVPVMCMFNPK